MSGARSCAEPSHEKVSRAEFFSALDTDPRDIMPKPVGRYIDCDGYTSEWRDRNGVLFGKSNNVGYWMQPSPATP